MYSWSKAPVSYQNWDNTDDKKILFGVYHYRKTYYNVKSISSYHRFMYDMACADHTAPLCFMKENDSKLIGITKARMYTLHSKYNESNLCTILYMPTLTDTQWISVNCDEMLIPKIVCSVKINKAGNYTPTTQPSIEDCSKTDLLLGGNCYLFMWIDFSQYHDITNMLHMFLEMSKQPSLFTTAEQRLFYKILNGINLDNFTFFTLTTNNTFNVKHVTFKRELFTWKVIQTSKATRGVLTWLSKPGVILSKTESIVKCDNGQFMSTAFILSESFNKKMSIFLDKVKCFIIPVSK